MKAQRTVRHTCAPCFPVACSTSMQAPDKANQGEPNLVAEHAQANLSALGHHDSFALHRQRLTARAVAVAPPERQGRLCILGAGNAFDVALDVLAEHYSEIHLVDVDEGALSRACDRQTPEVQRQLTLHAPVDLSGLFDRIGRWARFELESEELMNHATSTAAAVSQRIGGTFDVVLSACMLSQMQLDVVRVLGEQHRLFQAVRWTLNLTHFRVLAALTRSGGTAVFTTDATGNHLWPALDTDDSTRTLATLEAATRAGRIFDFAALDQIGALLLDDPVVRRAFGGWTLTDAWVWSNGPTARLLVYACDLRRA